MIFQKFDETDIVAGRTTRVASGFWPDGYAIFSQSLFLDDFMDLTTVTTPSPSYGTSIYDVRRTMYYLNVFPGTNAYPTDPYFSITYGHIGGDVGSGSFGTETSSIQVSPTKTIYTQYKNLLLGSSDLDGMFTMRSGNTTVNAEDIWVIDFSKYKMKDRIDEGLLELSFSSSVAYQLTLIDDSYLTSQTQAVYQLVEGTLETPPSSPTYEGLGLFYPQNGVVILNAALLAQKLGLWDTTTEVKTGLKINGYDYDPNTSTGSYTYNHETLFQLLKTSGQTMKVRKSEYVPSRHYFVRIKNRNFNYSNNPTYVYDGTDGIHAKGTIRNTDFINEPRTYITTVGLYNDNNELVAVAKLSRPALKTFDNELLFRVKLDF